MSLDELDEPVLVADLIGESAVPSGMARCTLVIGPRGGLHPDEIPTEAVRIGLSDRVLRAETAALVGAVVILGARHRRENRNLTHSEPSPTGFCLVLLTSEEGH